MVYINFEKIKNTFENFNKDIKTKTNLYKTGKFKVQLFMNVFLSFQKTENIKQIFIFMKNKN